jgi:Ca2+-binding EF-hand superfamily protein
MLKERQGLTQLRNRWSWVGILRAGPGILLQSPARSMMENICSFGINNEESFDSYLLVLSIYDQNNDGLLQFNEFERMADIFGTSVIHRKRLQQKFFPTFHEELTPDQFSNLWQEFFDENTDGLMQIDEFETMLLGLGDAVCQKRLKETEMQFFPTGEEEIPKERLPELLAAVEKLIEESNEREMDAADV